MIRLEHVGIAVSDLDATLRVMKLLCNRTPYKDEVVESEQVRTWFIEAGGTKIELLEALDSESALGRHLATRGPGLHHLAFETDDIDAAAERLETAGFRVLGAPRQGADNKRIFFVHPKDTAGILFECCASMDESGSDVPAVATDGPNWIGPRDAPTCLVIGSRPTGALATSLSRKLRALALPSGEDTTIRSLAPDVLIWVGEPTPDPVSLPDATAHLVFVDTDPGTHSWGARRGLVIETAESSAGTGHGLQHVHLPFSLLSGLPDPAGLLADLVASFALQAV